MSAQVSVADLQAFFLRSAAKTYAGQTVEKGTILGLPRSKVYRIEEGELLYFDTYFTNGEYSGGQTTVYFHGTPMWIMHYQGWCKGDDREVLAFLKRALLDRYSVGHFHLGRGPRRYFEEEPRTEGLNVQNTPLIYECFPNLGGPVNEDFSYFDGRERIYRHGDVVNDLFWHRFSGMLLRDEDREKQPWLPRA